jgi:hypothetical protein
MLAGAARQTARAAVGASGLADVESRVWESDINFGARLRDTYDVDFFVVAVSLTRSHHRVGERPGT